MDKRTTPRNRLLAGRTCAAFSLLEIIVVLALVGAFVKLLIPNISEFKYRLANRQSQLFYNVLKDVATAHTESIVVFRQEEKSELPRGIGGQNLKVPDGLRLNYFLRLPTADNHLVTALEVTHMNGSAVYRQVTFDDRIIEQVVQQ